MSDFDIIAGNLTTEETTDALLAAFNVSGKLHDMYLRRLQRIGYKNFTFHQHYFYGFLAGVCMTVNDRDAILRLDSTRQHKVIAAGLWAVTDTVDAGEALLTTDLNVTASYLLLGDMACLTHEELCPPIEGERVASSSNTDTKPPAAALAVCTDNVVEFKKPTRGKT